MGDIKCSCGGDVKIYGGQALGGGRYVSWVAGCNECGRYIRGCNSAKEARQEIYAMNYTSVILAKRSKLQDYRIVKYKEATTRKEE